MNSYVLECLIRERNMEAAAHAARERVLRSLRPMRPPVMVLLGTALIKLGSRLAGQAPAPQGEPDRVTA
jgi:hypothetical protein